MKYVGFIIVFLSGFVPAWGAGESTLSFVSSLSAPIASFETVETKACLPTDVNGGVTFNIGSETSAGGGGGAAGTIRIMSPKSSPMQIGTLTMSPYTTVKFQKKWLVNELTIEQKGSVKAAHLLAGNVTVPSNSKITKYTEGLELTIGSKAPFETIDACEIIVGEGDDPQILQVAQEDDDPTEGTLQPDCALGETNACPLVIK